MDPSVDKVTKDVFIPYSFQEYDDESYFHDSGDIGNKRFVVGFDHTLFKADKLLKLIGYRREKNLQGEICIGRYLIKTIC